MKKSEVSSTGSRRLNFLGFAISLFSDKYMAKFRETLKHAPPWIIFTWEFPSLLKIVCRISAWWIPWGKRSWVDERLTACLLIVVTMRPEVNTSWPTSRQKKSRPTLESYRSPSSRKQVEANSPSKKSSSSKWLYDKQISSPHEEGMLEETCVMSG